MTKKMTEGNPLKLILFFAFPLLIGNIFQLLYGVVDTIIVGRTIGVNALAAVGSTASITFLVIGFAVGSSSGLSIITSQRFGAGDEEGVKRSVATSSIIALMITVILTAITVPFIRQLLELMRTPPEIIEDAYSYIVVIMAGIFALMLFNLLSNMIRALGDSRTPLIFLAIACVINIALSFFFILVLGMGVAGCGYATVIAQLASALMCLLHIHRKLPILHVKKHHFRISKEDLLQHIRMGIPMGLQMSIIAIGALILQFVLNSLGPTAVASFTSSQRIDQIGTMPLHSFGLATGTFVAQNFGAGKLDRIRMRVRQIAVVAVVFSLLSGTMLFFFGRNVGALFVGHEAVEVLDKVQQYLRINGLFYWVLALLFVFRFSIQGLGNSTMPLITGAIELICRSFAGLVLAASFGFIGAVWSGPLAYVGAGIPLTVTFVYMIRKLNRLEREHMVDLTL